MSGIGDAINVQLYGGSDGREIRVSEGGGIFTQFAGDDIKNLKRFTIRNDRVTRLPDLPTSQVIIYSEEGNDPIWISGTGDDEPEVHGGIPLLEGNYAFYDVTNANKISMIAETNNQVVFVNAIRSGPNTLDPDRTVPTYPPDTTAPTITTASVSPANGATAVAWDVTISIPFSENLDPTTVNTTSFTMEDDDNGDAAVEVEVGLDPTDNSKVIVQPTSNLSSLHDYTVRVTTAVEDLAGNALASPYSFSFQAALNAPGTETTPPTFVSSTPTDDSTNVSLNATIVLTFSEAIQQPNAQTNPSIKLFKAANNQEVPISIYTMSTGNKSVQIGGFTLDYSTSYYIKAFGTDASGQTAVKDTVGNQMTTTTTIDFTTQSPPLETVYSVGGNTYYKLDKDNYILFAEKAVNTQSSLYNRTPQEWEFDVYKFGNPSGNYTIGWYRLSGGNYSLFRTLKTAAASSLSTTVGSKISINDSTNTTNKIQTGDYIGFAFTGGDSNNYIAVKASNTDVKDGTNSVGRRRYYTYGSSLPGFVTENDITSIDIAFTMKAPPL